MFNKISTKSTTKHTKYKLVLYGTDGRLFTTDVYAKFKVM